MRQMANGASAPGTCGFEPFVHAGLSVQGPAVAPRIFSCLIVGARRWPAARRMPVAVTRLRPLVQNEPVT